MTYKAAGVECPPPISMGAEKPAYTGYFDPRSTSGGGG
jgi:hypothetical protein